MSQSFHSDGWADLDRTLEAEGHALLREIESSQLSPLKKRFLQKKIDKANRRARKMRRR